MGYNILVDVWGWYFFNRENGNCLKVSVCFKAGGGHPPLLALLSCLVDVASKDNSNFGKGLGHSETPRLHRGTSYEPSS